MDSCFKHIALDLELEQPNSNNQVTDSQLEEEKIIQVGYVIFEIEPEFKVLKKVSKFVNIGVPLSTFIKGLTGISDADIASGGTIEEAYAALVSDMEEYDTLRVVKQWGGGDMDCLKKELPNEKWEFGRSGCNVKHMYQTYAEVNDLKRNGGLSKCMGRCGLNWQGRGKHNATVDALNTAVFYDYLARSMKNG